MSENFCSVAPLLFKKKLFQKQKLYGLAKCVRSLFSVTKQSLVIFRHAVETGLESLLSAAIVIQEVLSVPFEFSHITFICSKSPLYSWCTLSVWRLVPLKNDCKSTPVPPLPGKLQPINSVGQLESSYSHSWEVEINDVVRKEAWFCVTAVWKSVSFDYPIRIRLSVHTVRLYKHVKINKSDMKYFTTWNRCTKVPKLQGLS